MGKTNKTQKRFRIYLFLMGGLAIILLLLLLKGSIGASGTLSSSGLKLAGEKQAETISSTEDERFLPFVWTRTVFAGEKISDDMFMLHDIMSEKDDISLSEAELNQQLLLLRGRYLRENQLGGVMLEKHVLLDEIPLQATKGSQAIWVPLDDKQANGFANFELGAFVAAFSVSNSEDVTSVISTLEQLRILALDREANALCLELTAAQHISVLAHLQNSTIFFVPATGVEAADIGMESSTTPEETSSSIEPTTTTTATTTQISEVTAAPSQTSTPENTVTEATAAPTPETTVSEDVTLASDVANVSEDVVEPLTEVVEP